MFALPFVFVVFIIDFPAGLIVYWITTNVWTIGQQLAREEALSEAGSGRPRARLSRRATGNPRAGNRPVPRPRPRGTAAATTKAGEGEAKAKAKATNEEPAKAPPQSPRKKKKRSGRRR